jgi:hypothetical protein
MPAGARIVHVDVQRDQLYLWALVDNAMSKVGRRRFMIVSTGQVLPLGAHHHLGTLLLQDGRVVVHVFEFAW